MESLEQRVLHYDQCPKGFTHLIKPSYQANILVWATEQVWCSFLTDFHMNFPKRPIRLGSTQQFVCHCSQIPLAGCVQGNRLSPGRVISVHCSVAHSPKTELKAALEMKWVLS